MTVCNKTTGTNLMAQPCANIRESQTESTMAKLYFAQILESYQYTITMEPVKVGLTRMESHTVEMQRKAGVYQFKTMKKRNSFIDDANSQAGRIVAIPTV